jgi:hypothetical protein
VTTLRFQFVRNAQWEQWILLRSDAHDDNPLSNRKLQRKHLDQALERNAPVCDFGDLFCAMQGRNDRRRERGHIRDGEDKPDYWGELIRGRFDFLAPYSSVLALFGQGNHETGVLKNCEIDLTRALVDRLNDRGSPAVMGGYRGWLRIMFGTCDRRRQSFKLYYTHGGGGSAPVTKGVIRTNRRASYIDADIIVGGHIHESWSMELCRIALSGMGVEYVKPQQHICIPTYKEEFTGLGNGYHHENERPPKPLGAHWLRFFWDRSDETIKFEDVRAK